MGQFFHVENSRPGSTKNPYSRKYDKSPFKPGRKVFDLTVPVRMVPISRHVCYDDADKGKNTSYNINDGFKCIGKNRSGVS